MAVTQKWSRRRLRTQSNDDGSPNWQAQIVWEVDGVANDVEARYAVPEATEGAPHPLNSEIVVVAVDVQEPRKGLWEVTATYGVPPGQAAGGGGGIIDRPRFTWEDAELELPYDVDSEGNTISNSALDAVDPPPTDAIPVWFYTVTLAEDFFDANFAKPYLNAVNTDPFVTPFGTFDPLEVKCRSIRPAEDFVRGMRSLNVAYRFEIRLRSFFPRIPDDISPFDVVFPDMGYNAYCRPPNQGFVKDRIYGTQHGPVNAPVRLDGKGQPFDTTSYKVGRALQDPANAGTPPGATAVKLSDVVLLYYKRPPRKTFADLALPTGR